MLPGIFRQVTPHRTKLRSHRENIARYFNESEVMMYLHDIIVYTTVMHAMCPNLFNIPLLTKIRSTLFIHFQNYWYSNKRSNYFEFIYTIIFIGVLRGGPRGPCPPPPPLKLVKV